MTPRGSDTPEINEAVDRVNRSNEAVIGANEANRRLLEQRAAAWQAWAALGYLVVLVAVLVVPAVVMAVWRWALT